MDENYFKKINPRYLELKGMIEQKESRINSGIITNSKTLKYAKRDIERWKNQLSEVDMYID